MARVAVTAENSTSCLLSEQKVLRADKSRLPSYLFNDPLEQGTSCLEGWVGYENKIDLIDRSIFATILETYPLSRNEWR